MSATVAPKFGGSTQSHLKVHPKFGADVTVSGTVAPKFGCAIEVCSTQSLRSTVVSITATAVAPDRALEALVVAIAAAKRDDPLARVTVAVPTNTCGVMALFVRSGGPSASPGSTWSR